MKSYSRPSASANIYPDHNRNRGLAISLYLELSEVAQDTFGIVMNDFNVASHLRPVLDSLVSSQVLKYKNCLQHVQNAHPTHNKCDELFFE